MDKGAKNRSGSVTFVQRFGSALNLNVHFHLLQMEGAYDYDNLAMYRRLDADLIFKVREKARLNCLPVL